MWFEGLQFFWKPKSTWQLCSGVLKVDTPDPEVKKEILVNAITINSDILGRVKRRISSWNKMRRVIAMVLRFKSLAEEVISKEI